MQAIFEAVRQACSLAIGRVESRIESWGAVVVDHATKDER